MTSVKWLVPCQLFGANAAWFRINVLTFISSRLCPGASKRYRLARAQRLGFEVFTLPGKLAVHESQLAVQSAADAPAGDGRGTPAFS